MAYLQGLSHISPRKLRNKGGGETSDMPISYTQFKKHFSDNKEF
jgi:hypothetical protein